MMRSNYRPFIRLELCNLYDINVLIHTKDGKAKKKAIALLLTYCLVVLIICFYMAVLSYGLVQIGAADAIVPYLTVVASVFIFFFGMFKAGSVIFRQSGYDILCSLPVRKEAIVFARFARLYIENLLLTIIVLLPGVVIDVYFNHRSVLYYLFGVLGILMIPLLPIAAATFFGTLVTAVSSRMRRKSLVTSLLSIALVIAIMAGSSSLSTMEGEVTNEQLLQLSSMISDILAKLYPPAVWLREAMVNHDLMQGVLFCIVSLAGFFIVHFMVAKSFHVICRGLFSSVAKHNYTMKRLRQSTILSALCKREMKRYFSSSVYVTNTIIGPILGTAMAVAIAVFGTDTITKSISLPVDINTLLPFLLPVSFCMMTTTSTSISMEGKQWWIVKSLPLSSKTILDAKIIMNLLLLLPFYLVSEVLLMIACKLNFMETLLLLCTPAAFILFSCVFGITINLQLPVLHWETEVSVVKQSAAAMIGGLGGMMFSVLAAIIILLVPQTYAVLTNVLLILLMLLVTAFLYHKNNQTDLREID